MISISLPIRPRINTRAEYLTTIVAVGSSKADKKISCLTNFNLSSEKEREDSIEYEQIISKFFSFDEILKDNSNAFLSYVNDVVPKLHLIEKMTTILTCDCGKYEEVVEARMFNLRRVKEGVCTYCNTEIKEIETKALFMDMDWEKISKLFQFNPKRAFSQKDFEHFILRQDTNLLKVSKQISNFRINYNNKDFGIKHQFIWAMIFPYLQEIYKENSFELNVVCRSSSVGLLVASIAEQITNFKLNFNFELLPVLWLPEEISIKNITKKEISALRYGIENSFSKERKIDSGLFKKITNEIKLH